ncbi:MAG: thermonuclease family protein [Cypionkella sp.]|nr:thermonuclease family protein [Cypionkella sp.]
MREILRGGQVQIYPQGHDKYGRELVVITVGGAAVADAMIARGLAEPYAGAARRDWCD